MTMEAMQQDVDLLRPRSVLQDWVMDHCTLRMQGVLVLALRGPDGEAKEGAAKPIVRALRGITMVSARIRDTMRMGMVWTDDPFMQTILIGSPSRLAWDMAVTDFYGDIDRYNLHFYFHLLHAYAVSGLFHPNDMVRDRCWDFYQRGVHEVHCLPETGEMITHRLRDGVRK